MLLQLGSVRLCALVAIIAATVAAPAADAGKPGGSTGGGGGKADRTAPTVTITTPAQGATASGQLTVKGAASDNAAVARVEISVDGGAYRLAAGTTSWSAPLDTTTLGNGTHSISARAVDGAGNSSLAGVTFTISNAAPPADTTPPAIAISAPSDGAAVPRQMMVTGTAADNDALAKLEVRLDGGAFQAATGTTSWSANLDASSAADGSHVVTARATDAAGNVSSTSVSVVVSDQAVNAPPMSSGTIGGYVFQEHDRDGVVEAGETRLANQNIYLFDASGTFLRNVYSDASGWYEFTGLAPATYSVEIAPVSWNALQYDWVPDTTGSIRPRVTVGLAGSSRTDFGMRPIVRSTDVAAPISTYVGANGLTVKSYNDAVAAKEIHDRLLAGSMVGVEAQFVTIRFDYRTTGMTTTRTMQDNGVYTDYRATSDVTWLTWLRSDNELFHEYGHAWSLYFANMVQHDTTFAGYLRARGLYGDPRIGSGYGWDVREMIAEDYRQLFGTATAVAGQQLNRDIPRAADVPGLREYLATTFQQPPQ